jgi:putative endopeptidase
MIRNVALFAAALTATACIHKRPQAVVPVAVAPVVVAAPVPKTVEMSLAEVGLDATAMDRSVDPCTDFYQFACGGWLKRTPIPEDRSQWTRSFSEIEKRNVATLHDILENAAKAPGDDPVLKKIGSFYGACMDEPAIERAGTKPIEKLLAAARSVKKNKTSLDAALVALQVYRVPILFELAPTQDSKDATKMIATLDQSGLGLPDREYYLSDDPKNQEIRQTYVAHVARMLTLAGMDAAKAKKAAADVMRFETEIAKVSKTRVERRDPQGTYNKIDLAGLKKATPAFPWDAYFKAVERPDLVDIAVTSIPFFEGINKLIEKTKPETWHNYLQWHVLQATASKLSKAFVDENFSLEAALTGTVKIEDRWKRCTYATDDALGELLAQPFVKTMFGGESKTATETMVREIRDAFGQGLKSLDWMDETTRARAAEKLKAVSFHIGYPLAWKSYDFPVEPTNYAGNVLVSRAFELKRDLGKIGKPVDLEQWDMTPPTVNAYYDPQKNTMVFPAGILQTPFFDAKAGVAVNMGGMGMVVGHELTHGFDDQGAQYDAAGNLRNWWEPAVNDKFKAKGQCIASQYDKYEPLPGLHVQGALTEGENIADNGGVKLAFHAYRAMRSSAPERISAEGFTEDQQFFLALGQSWCTNSREQVARMLVTTDPHSPPRFRVNGSLSNTPEFHEAFACKAGTPMRPANACQVW